jgi:type I restriction enzyme S subunit
MAKNKAKEINNTVGKELDLSSSMIPEEKQPYKIPENWVWTTLRSVCDLLVGGDVPKGDFSEFKSEKQQIPIYANGEKNNGLYGYTSVAKITKPSVTISARGTIGFSVKRLENFYPIVRLIVLTPKNAKHIDLSFLYYSTKVIDFKNNGSSIPQLTAPVIGEYKTPLPPLPEQQRIVEKLESMLGKIKQAKELIEDAKETFKNRRASILAKAFSGELTNKKISDLKRIDELTIFLGSGVTPKGGSSVYVESGIPFIRSQNVYPEGLFLDNIVYITEETHNKMSRTKLKPNDVLLNITGASIGRSTVVPENFKDGNVNQHVCIIRLNELQANSKYVSFYLNSPHGQKIIFNEQVGMTREALNYTQLKAIEIPLPLLFEQKEIVRIVENLLNKENEALEKIESMEEHLSLLEKSILSKAFRGELGTNNPDEESAINLLKEILSSSTSSKK